MFEFEPDQREQWIKDHDIRSMVVWEKKEEKKEAFLEQEEL